MTSLASASSAYIDTLAAKDLIAPDTVTRFGRGQLVIWSRPDSPLPLKSLGDLLRPELERFAMANPVHAPYGIAAREALQRAGLWDRLQHKLVMGRNVRQAMHYAESGNVDAALAARSLCRPGKDRWVAVPGDLYRPPYQVPGGDKILGASCGGTQFRRLCQYPSGSIRHGKIRSSTTSGFTEPMSWHPLLLSLKVTSAATLLIFAIGLGLAIFFARHQFRGQTILETAIHLPLVLPPSVVGFYLLIMLGRDGPLAHLFGWNLLFTWPAAVIASTVVGLPLMFQAARSAIANVDPDLEHAARTLGSTELEVMWRITLPLSRRGILAGLSWAPPAPSESSAPP